MRILTAAETAERLRLSLRTLERITRSGDGPPKIRLSRNRVGYAESDVTAWIESRAKGAGGR